MVTCTTDCIEKPIRICFERLGKFIGLHPWWFFIIPVVLSVVLGGGFCFLNENNDIEEQFTPMDGAAKQERQFFLDTFRQNSSMFTGMRVITNGVYASLIFRDTKNILTVPAFEEILRIDNKIRNITVQKGAEQFNFSDICARVGQRCWSNVILDIFNYNASKVNVTNITFPIHALNSGENVSLELSLGGEEVNNNSFVQSAKALRLMYFLREDHEDKNKTDEWLTKFIQLLRSESESAERTAHIKVSYYTSLSMQQEFEKSSESVIKLFSITYFLAISFSILSCLRFDNVRNKVWVATVGVFSAGLAVVSSMGLMLIFRVPFVITVALSPFLVLGIGIDDMFIMISSWQQTNVHDEVSNRMADTYRDAAISITVTTLTDILALFLSYSNPFGSVQSFCLYAGTAILFCYLYNITFFGAFLALNGIREKENRHWFTCMKIPEECPLVSTKAYLVCCVGGAYDHDTGTEEEQPIRRFIRKYYGPFLATSWVKVVVVVLYIGYLSLSIYGCHIVNQGIDLRHLAKDKSYVVSYYDDHETYFRRYGPTVMLAVNGTFRYWNVTEREELENCITNFKNLISVKSVSTSWLHSFEDYADRSDINISSETPFEKHLQSFLDRYEIFRQDVKITHQHKVHASRLFLQTVNFNNSAAKTILESLRKTAKDCSQPLVVYHPSFIFYDQYAVIEDITIQTVCVATVAMLFISFLLIPSPFCALWVTFAIGSVIVGVIGFMALINISLDSISMINLIISIGFSVDFSAHISYSFVSSTKAGANERMVDALSHLGYPILQGALSTILGVVVLSASESYIFRTFCKITSLVIVFGLLHGIAFIPVFLTFLGICIK
ncbi:patched domain-containing protein 3 [Chanos chanos]|uniref:Patched domain-containing protein 3 n=1 Tax=Chanos chanos TaxID=29144 RepID=A0A6J2VFM4_CHACN|nr:patched domain-containing protein 3-like [Chanos chanos]